ncbi:Hypothetical predicted protein [Xyrichtys novacula]|uniref:Uncharacterized protein n=1 Tax=Xyrichtys novacula TaxID=13765 RepID=A0AAV1FZ24_XYRNO|nr:Hypothetical predicted protein [Xyrichtys novacula]
MHHSLHPPFHPSIHPSPPSPPSRQHPHPLQEKKHQLPPIHPPSHSHETSTHPSVLSSLLPPFLPSYLPVPSLCPPSPVTARFGSVGLGSVVLLSSVRNPLASCPVLLSFLAAGSAGVNKRRAGVRIRVRPLSSIPAGEEEGEAEEEEVEGGTRRRKNRNDPAMFALRSCFRRGFLLLLLPLLR